MLLRTTRDGAGLTVTLRDCNDNGKQARLLGIPRFFPITSGLHHSSGGGAGPQCAVSPGLPGACRLGVRRG